MDEEIDEILDRLQRKLGGNELDRRIREVERLIKAWDLKPHQRKWCRLVIGVRLKI